jgi:hypothetical protein
MAVGRYGGVLGRAATRAVQSRRPRPAPQAPRTGGPMDCCRNSERTAHAHLCTPHARPSAPAAPAPSCAPPHDPTPPHPLARIHVTPTLQTHPLQGMVTFARTRGEPAVHGNRRLTHDVREAPSSRRLSFPPLCLPSPALSYRSKTYLCNWRTSQIACARMATAAPERKAAAPAGCQDGGTLDPDPIKAKAESFRVVGACIGARRRAPRRRRELASQLPPVSLMATTAPSARTASLAGPQRRREPGVLLRDGDDPGTTAGHGARV